MRYKGEITQHITNLLILVRNSKKSMEDQDITPAELYYRLKDIQLKLERIEELVSLEPTT